MLASKFTSAGCVALMVASVDPSTLRAAVVLSPVTRMVA
jgi:hypothetical protein